VKTELSSLLVIAAIAAFVPLIIGLVRIRVAEVVLLLGFGVLFGPEVLGWIQLDGAVTFLSELGLGFLFFLAGLELEKRAVTGQSGRLAAIGWIASFAIALGAAFVLSDRDRIVNVIAIAIALTSTALGTMLPVLRDRGELKTSFGTFFMGAGAWGELGPILAMSLLLSTRSEAAAVVALILFAVIAVLAALPARYANARVRELIQRGHTTSSQTALRLAILLLVLLLAATAVLKLDAVLGAFIAGIITRRFASPEVEPRLQKNLEAIGFGLFIPLFFIVSGAKLDVISIVENPAPMFIAFIFILMVRGVPQWFVYKGVLPQWRVRTRFALFVATGLPIIVAVTSAEVNAGLMTSANAAALVGAGALTVLVFPLVGVMIDRSPSRESDATAVHR
jgi:Kef-type K+ transport system membrane component KefB